MSDEAGYFADTFQAGRVGGHHAVEVQALLGLLDGAVAVKELVFLRDAVLVPAGHFLALVAEREREAELRADAIPVRADVADDTDGAAFAEGFDDAVDDL